VIPFCKLGPTLTLACDQMPPVIPIMFMATPEMAWLPPAFGGMEGSIGCLGAIQHRHSRISGAINTTITSKD
jgi:hypothetical protein